MNVGCPECGLRYQCVCNLVPQIPEQTFSIALLMHPNEQHRDTNTGKLLSLGSNKICTYIWERKTPSKSLLELLQNPSIQPVILFPSENTLTPSEVVEASRTEKKRCVFIVLDATWQEANKMLNKSKWLEGIPLVSFETNAKSSYQLRRNQQQGNLCTYEVIAYLIEHLGDTETPPQMLSFFEQYTRVFQADKSGHKLNL